MTFRLFGCGRRGYLYPRAVVSASGELPIIIMQRDGIASGGETAMMPMMSLINLTRLRDCPLQRDPFDFVVVEDFLAAESAGRLVDEFPRVPGHGSYPLSMLACSPLFMRLTDELEGEEMRAAIEDKFALDLAARPTMITLRGYGDGKDGGIHTDSVTKLITVLIYMNHEWSDRAGRLRLLRGPKDLADYAAEIPPLGGTMIAFRRSEVSFHGHVEHVGKRQSIQLNWVTDAAVVRRELSRHIWTARFKALNPFKRQRSRLANEAAAVNLLAN
jgi:SM-20-related protein